MNKRTKATDISKKVKDIVWERDNQRCIICGSSQAMPNGHYLSRAKSGLGIKENIVTLCNNCHRMFDNPSPKEIETSKEIKREVKAYLDMHYPNFEDNRRVYHK